ncbi:MAG: DUF4267 domain-containing protein [Pseudomonadota bacterium]
MTFLPNLAWVVAAVLCAAGLAFILSPEWAFAHLDHTRDGLPIVFGGRYLGLAVAFSAFAYFKDLRGLAIMSAAGAMMAAVDVVTYWSAGEPLTLVAPHAIVLLLGVFVAVSVFRSTSRGLAQ